MLKDKIEKSMEEKPIETIVSGAVFVGAVTITVCAVVKANSYAQHLDKLYNLFLEHAHEIRVNLVNMPPVM